MNLCRIFHNMHSITYNYNALMCTNNADGMANSVDPVQTAPRSSLIWACTVYSDLPVAIIRIFTIHTYNFLSGPEIDPYCSVAAMSCITKYWSSCHVQVVRYLVTHKVISYLE